MKKKSKIKKRNKLRETKKRNKKFLCEQDQCTGVLERGLDAPSFQLKGDGWAKDGYGKKQKPKPKEEKKE